MDSHQTHCTEDSSVLGLLKILDASDDACRKNPTITLRYISRVLTSQTKYDICPVQHQASRFSHLMVSSESSVADQSEVSATISSLIGLSSHHVTLTWALFSSDEDFFLRPFFPAQHPTECSTTRANATQRLETRPTTPIGWNPGKAELSA